MTDHPPRFRPGDRVKINAAFVRGKVVASVQDPATRQWFYEVAVDGRGRYRNVPERSLVADA